MANKWAIASGKWSSTATWNDGVIPIVGDIVYANGQTITFDTTDIVNVSKLTNVVNEDLGIVSGGSFSFTSSATSMATFEFTADIENDDANYCFMVNTAHIIINGNITGYKALKVYSSVASVMKVTINGNVDGGFTKDSGSDQSSFSFVINGNWVIRKNNYFIYFERTNWYAHQGISFTINGDFTSNTDLNLTNVANSATFFAFTFNGQCNLNGGVNFTYVPYANNYSRQNVFFEYGYNAASYLDGFGTTTFNSIYGTHSQIYRNGELCLIGVDVVNYPKIEDVKLGVKYGSEDNYTGIYSPMILTDDELNRIKNCATTDQVRYLSITIADKDLPTEE